MKLLPVEEMDKSNGVFGLIFGGTGVGKTASSIQSLPKPILILSNERRNINIQARAVNVPAVNTDGSINYIVAVYENFPGLIDFIGNIKNNITKQICGIDYVDIKSILVDGVTQLTMSLRSEVADYAAEKRADDKRNFIADVKVSEEGYGAIAERMLRVTGMLSKLSEVDSKIVVMTTLLGTVNDAWNGTQKAIPEFVGRMYGDQLPGMCDFIGMVERRFEDVEVETPDGHKKIIKQIAFPPIVKFETLPSENFQCKWSGARPQKDGKPVPRVAGPLDLSVIIERVLSKKLNNETQTN